MFEIIKEKQIIPKIRGSKNSNSNFRKYKGVKLDMRLNPNGIDQSHQNQLKSKASTKETGPSSSLSINITDERANPERFTKTLCLTAEKKAKRQNKTFEFLWFSNIFSATQMTKKESA